MTNLSIIVWICEPFSEKLKKLRDSEVAKAQKICAVAGHNN